LPLKTCSIQWHFQHRINNRIQRQCHVPRRSWTSRLLSSYCFVVYCGFGSVSVSEYDSLQLLCIYITYYTIIHSHLHVHLSACNSTSPLSTNDSLYLPCNFPLSPASISRGDWPFNYVTPPLTRRAASSPSQT